MKRFIIMLGLVLAVTGPTLFTTLPAYADATDSAKSAVCDSLKQQVGGSCGGSTGLSDFVHLAITILSGVAGIAAVVMIIYAGFKYITSGGDGQAVASAKKALIYAIVGIVVVALAQVLVKFVIFSANT